MQILTLPLALSHRHRFRRFLFKSVVPATKQSLNLTLRLAPPHQISIPKMFQNWALPCPVRFSSLKSQVCACCSPQLCLFFVKRISIIYYPWTSSGSISKQPRTGSVLVPTRCFLELELPKNRANKLKRIVSNSDLFIAVCFLPLLLLDILFR